MVALKCQSQSHNENTTAKSKKQQQITKHNRKTQLQKLKTWMQKEKNTTKRKNITA